MLSTLTVISALHDAEPDIAEFFERLESLQLPGLQFVLIDDASTDGTWAALQAFAARDPRVTALHNEVNTGVGGARNRALAASTTDYIWFVDHDDEWFAHSPHTLLKAAEETGADLVAARAEYRHNPSVPGRIVDGVDERRILTRAELIDLMLAGRVHGFLWSKLIRRTSLGVDPFPSLTSQSDFVGLTRAVARTTAAVVIPDVVYRYLRRPGSLTRVRSPRLGNVAAARDAMHELIAETSTPVDAELLDYFDMWFYAVAAAFTPLRWNAPAAVCDEGITRAREASTGVPVRSLWRRSRSTALHIAVLRHAPLLYRRGLPVVLRLKDWMRDARTS